MSFQYFAGAAYRALTAGKDGPSLYDVCDPAAVQHATAATRISPNSTGPRSAIRRCGRCCAGPGCPNCATRRGLRRLREALRQARDDAAPDWAAIGQPVAALLDTIDAVSIPSQRGATAGRPARRRSPRSSA